MSEPRRPTDYPATPTLDRISEVKEEAQAIGEFLDWLLSIKGAEVCHYRPANAFRPDGYYPLKASIEELLAEFFQIDLAAKEREQRAVLAYVQNMEEK